MKKYILTFILMNLIILISYSQNYYIQCGGTLNYGFTSLKSSYVGTGFELTFKQCINDNISMKEGFNIDLTGGKTNNLKETSYGNWHFQGNWCFDYNILETNYIIIGISGNISRSIFINTNLTDKELYSKKMSLYPGIIFGIGKSIQWGYNNNILIELKYNYLMTDQYDNIQLNGINHNDSYINLGFKIELPL